MTTPRSLADLKAMHTGGPRRNESPGTPETYMGGTQFALFQLDDQLSENTQQYIREQAQRHANLLNSLNSSFPGEKPESLTAYTGARDVQRTMAHYVVLSERGEELPGGITGRDVAIMRRNPGVAGQIAAARQDVDNIGTVNTYVSGVRSALPAGLSQRLVNSMLRGAKDGAEFVDRINTEFSDPSILDKGKLSSQRGAKDTYERMADIVLAHQRNERSIYEMANGQVSAHDVQVMSRDPNVRALVEGPSMLEAARREIQGISGLSDSAKERAFRLVQAENQHIENMVENMVGQTGPRPHEASDARDGQEMAQTALLMMAQETRKPGSVSGDTSELGKLFLPTKEITTLNARDMTVLQRYAPVGDMLRMADNRTRSSAPTSPTQRP